MTRKERVRRRFREEAKARDEVTDSKKTKMEKVKYYSSMLQVPEEVLKEV